MNECFEFNMDYCSVYDLSRRFEAAQALGLTLKIIDTFSFEELVYEASGSRTAMDTFAKQFEVYFD